MLDKKLTFKTANQALKEIIIPELGDGVAKEQAIALISVLKNLDMWTVENISPKEQLIAKMQRTLEEQFQKLEQDSTQFSTLDWKRSLEESVRNTEGLEDITEKWKALNDIQCQLIKHLYEENDRNPAIQESYITPLREKVREQLNIEMSLVR